jgi:superoxide dismutase, Cu-Zn family
MAPAHQATAALCARAQAIRMKTHNLALLIPFAVLVACSRAETPPVTATTTTTAPSGTPGASAQAVLFGASGTSVSGELALTSDTSGVTVAGELNGLEPNTVHGFHVHENGDCSAPDATSAGEHFNPDNSVHGAPTSMPRHLGDMPNLQADAQGHATVSATIGGATLRDGGAHDLMGKALIVHAKRDDYMTQPSGDSGDRIACGVIR